MRRVLLLTVTAGNGHNSACNAMNKKLIAAGYETKVVDLFKECASKLDTWIVDGGYNLAVGYLTPIYNAFYNHYLKDDPKKANRSSVQYSVRAVNEKLLKIIYDFKPDVIYSTCYYCGVALANLRRVYKIDATSISCLLDYVCSPFWEATVGGIDILAIPNEDFRDTLISKGFKSENLVDTGIPVGEKFLEHIDKSVARKNLGLKDAFTILIFFGGGHWGGNYNAFKAVSKILKKDMQIVVINGHNEKERKKIEKLAKKLNIDVRNEGFIDIDKVSEYMSASDVMIGKGGGLSSTESINKTLPLIATTKLPAQEFYNIKYLESKGCGLSYHNEKELQAHIENLYNNPERLRVLASSMERLKKNGINELFNIIISQKEIEYDDNISFENVNKKVKKARLKKTK